MLLSLFLFALDQVPVLVSKLAAKNLDKVNKISDAEHAGRQRIENTRADLSDIVAVDAEAAKEAINLVTDLPPLVILRFPGRVVPLLPVFSFRH